MSSDKCFICDKDLNDGTVKLVKEKGIETLRDASKRRIDGKGAVLAGKKSINVHQGCQKSYINERMISAQLKKAAKPSTSFLQLRSSSVNEFSFKTHCFVCGTHIPEDYSRLQQRLPPNEPNFVHHVPKIEVKVTVINKLNYLEMILVQQL